MTTDLHHLAAAYSLDALDPGERREFEAHIDTCEICAEEVLGFRETAAQLAAASHRLPPDDLKARVMAEVATTRQLPPRTSPASAGADPIDLDQRRKRRTVVARVAAAAAVVVLVVGLSSALLLTDGPTDVEELVAAPDAVVTQLEGSAGNVRVLWSEDLDRVAVIANDLDDPGEGKAYELWFVVQDGVAPAGTFAADGGTSTEVIEADGTTPDGWGVSIEPEDGSAQPTSDVILTGELA